MYAGELARIVRPQVLIRTPECCAGEWKSFLQPRIGERKYTTIATPLKRNKFFRHASKGQGIIPLPEPGLRCG